MFISFFQYGWYAHPIVFGDYPEIMKSRIADRSKLQGFPRSRLPSFTEEEKAYLKGTYDFLAVNTYTSDLVKPYANRKLKVRDWDIDAEVTYWQPDTWEKTGDPWMKVNLNDLNFFGCRLFFSFKVTPWGMRKLLNWVSKTYGNPDIIVTENGSADNDGKLNDKQRIRFIRVKSYLNYFYITCKYFKLSAICSFFLKDYNNTKIPHRFRDKQGNVDNSENFLKKSQDRIETVKIKRYNRNGKSTINHTVLKNVQQCATIDVQLNQRESKARCQIWHDSYAHWHGLLDFSFCFSSSSVCFFSTNLLVIC